jgi:hypothetical protein
MQQMRSNPYLMNQLLMQVDTRVCVCVCDVVYHMFHPSLLPTLTFAQQQAIMQQLGMNPVGLNQIVHMADAPMQQMPTGGMCSVVWVVCVVMCTVLYWVQCEVR